MVPYPKTEWLMHQDRKHLSEAQQARFQSMSALCDCLNRAMREDMIRSSGKYREMLFSEFLEKLGETVQNLLDRGESGLLLDDFVRIARFSLPAIRHIASSPSTRLARQTEQVPLRRLRKTDATTLRHLAKKPGRTMAEKLAPQYKVRTKVTCFSADTPENREFLYLYKLLYDVLCSRICCKGSEEERNAWGEEEQEALALIRLRNKIRTGALADVPAVRQSIQNNKLLCDKYYKMVWDAVRELSLVEKKLSLDWTALEERYMQLAYWCILAGLFCESELQLYDFWGALHDEGGRLWFGGDEPPLEACTTLLLPSRPDEPFLLKKQDQTLLLQQKNSGAVLERWNLRPLFLGADTP